jgi:hypothetical protein
MEWCHLTTLLAVGFSLGFIAEGVAIFRIWWRAR